MSARAPQAIEDVYFDVHKKIPKSVFSGIVGDVHHSFGYHLARRDLPASDYSVQLKQDKEGASDCASALDISLPPDLMKICTQRLVTAAQKGDKRLSAVREFCGTLDGRNTYPWQLVPTDGSEGEGTWDDSHLWHIHISFLREYADVYTAMKGLADVMAGTPIQRIITAIGSNSGWPFPKGSKNVYGYTEVPGLVVKRGGFSKEDQAYVVYIQKALQFIGAVPAGVNWKPDGSFGPETEKVVKAWQKSAGRGVTGRIASSDWKALCNAVKAKNKKAA